MSQDHDSGDKTEQPTPKKLHDARRKGQVPKSKDLTSTVELFVWFALALGATGWAAAELAALMRQALELALAPGTFANHAPLLGAAALGTLVMLTAVIVLPVAAVGLLVEYLQAGPVWALDRVKPRLEHMNPVEGVKNMFKLDALVELAKAVVKTAALLGIGGLAVLSLLPQIVQLPLQREPLVLGRALAEAAHPVLLWTVVAFTLLAALDAIYQRFSFMKKMRMSLRDIRQEIKDAEGDPHIKSHRRQTQQEWAQQQSTSAARGANALVVNPTHVAIAIDYDRETCPVPTIAGKGEDHVARAMREAAEEAGVPIVRNVALARDLLVRGEVGELVPQDLFDVIAEVVLWAREVRDELADPAAGAAPARRRREAPGEDLTLYPARPARGVDAPEGSAFWPPHDPA
jgi:type III secretion YscU/HrpY family protein